MQVVILAGGLGTRISEESYLKPKPMIEVGNRPIIWHIMKHFGQHGLTDFVICCGYKGYVIKEYFANYFMHMSDITIDLSENSIEVHNKRAEPWRITLVDTGEQTLTGGRLKRVADYLEGPFCMTYGDGVSDVDVAALVAHHKRSGLEATVTGVQPSGRFGTLEIEGDTVTRFREKIAGDGQWINGGFFVCETSVIDRVAHDGIAWEREPLEAIAREGQLGVYRHDGFWAAMDTMRDKQQLEELWASGSAPWRSWA